MYQVRAQPARSSAVYGIPRAPAVPRELSSAPSLASEPSSIPLLGSLLLLVTSYMLLLSIPLLSRKLGAWPLVDAHVERLSPLLPVASGAGLTLGGAAALVFVLMRLSREAEARPYAALAPALAAFAGCIAVGLRATLPLGGVASEQVAVFALVVSVLGGSLAQARGLLARSFGLVCTLLPTLTLLLVVWVTSGDAPALAFSALSAATRAYLTILSVSSLAICVLALVARNAHPVELENVAPAQFRTVITRELSFADECDALRRRATPGLRAVGVALLSLCVAFVGFKLLLPRRAPSSQIPVVQVQSLPPVQAPAPTVQLGAMVVTSLAPTATQPASEPLPAPQAEPTTPVRELAAAIAEAAAPAQPAPATQAVQPAEPPRELVPHRSTRRAHARVERSHARAAAPAAAPVKEPAPVARPERKAAEAPRSQEPAEKLADKPTAEPRVARKEPAAPAVEAPVKHAKGDDSLDALMDGALRGKGRPAAVGQSDDPIFGL